MRHHNCVTTGLALRLWQVALSRFLSFAALLCLSLSFTAIPALGQSNPVPFVNQPLVPSAVAPGGPDFTLTVNGTGFVSGATVNWNGTPLATTFVSSSQLTATVPAANTALNGTASITVLNPGQTTASNVIFLQVTPPSHSASFVQQGNSQGIIPGPLAMADFNGDGRLDVAGVLFFEGNSYVSALLGNGDGTFQSPVLYEVCSIAKSIAAADVNGDGKLDLVLAKSGCATGPGGTLSILLGKGDGTFQPAVDYAAGPAATALFAADLNGDGKLDLAITNSLAEGTPDTVSILLGNGDGTFQPPVAYTVGFNPYSVVAGDLNGDGKLDLAVANLGSSFSPTVSVLLGNGDGTFEAQAEYPMPTSSNPTISVLVADLNADGKLDLLVNTGLGLSVLLGNGDGTFQPRVDYSINFGQYPSSLAAGDFNADGNLDVTVGDLYTDGFVGAVLLGNGDGTFQTPSVFQISGGDPRFVAAGDLNQDGSLDLAFSSIFAHFAVLLQPPVLDLEPRSLDFRDQDIGMASSPQTVTLKNNLAAGLDISAIAITGTDAADFTEANDCPISPATLAPGGSCIITVTFAPSTIGAMTAAVTISNNDPGSPQQTVNLTGNGINPIVTLSATSLSFSSQPVSTTSAAQPVTVTNSGTTPLIVSGITTSGDFEQTNNCPVPPTLAVSAACTINVTFTPTAGGTVTGTLTITDNALSSPQTVSLTGVGVPPAVTLSATDLMFGSYAIGVPSSLQTVTVTNNGPGPLAVTKVTTSGAFSQTNNCVGTVAALANCTINVTYTPTASGPQAGFLTITDNAVASPQTVSLTGTGVSPTATASPASLSFGGQAVGTTSVEQAVTLTNGSSGPLSISGITVTGTNKSDFLQGNNCPISPATLAASAPCTINVSFKPSINGAESATLTINDNSTSSPHTVSLGGTGQAPVAALSPASLDFPGQSVHVTSAPETVTLTDSGGLPLTISNVSVTSPFAIQSSNCPSPSSSLPAGQGCTINLTFTAGFAGTTFGSLVVSDNSLGSATQTVSLTGEATVSFGAQLAGTTSVPQAVTIANGSTTKSVTVTSVTATGDFAVASNPCGVIVPGGNCAPMVTFKPTAGGTRKGALVITDNSPGSPHMVALSGTGEDFALSTNQVSATVAAGGTATFTLLVASQGGFNQTVNLSCALPATMAHATCAVTPSSVTPSSATAATPTVTITTTAPTMVAPQFRQRPDGLPGVPGLFGAEPWAHRHVPLQMLWLLALALLAAVAASCVSPLRSISARRSSPLQLSRIARALTLLMLLAWAACGGGPAPVHLAGTAPGNYTITLTATDPQASLTQTTTVNLTVSQ